MIRYSDGGVEMELGENAAGLPLYVDSAATFSAVNVPVEPGTAVLAFTDGLSEAMTGDLQLLGIPRLCEFFRQAPKCPIEAGETIVKQVNNFVGGYDQSDDMTLVCLGRAE
jgi:sigma-B regulation protein RsbU (phosphoserine phosphatase)